MTPPTNRINGGRDVPTPATTPSASSVAGAASATVQDGLTYQSGFGNHQETEAVPSTLPRGRNNPRAVPGNLYAEQLSGTAFTAPRSVNRRVWLYRVQPGVAGTSSSFEPCGVGIGGGGADAGLPRHFGDCEWPSGLRLDPNPMRWGPMPLPAAESDGRIDFIRGVKTFMGNGDPTSRSGLAIHEYSFNADMLRSRANDDDSDDDGVDVHMYNSDGDFLLVPQLGSLSIYTEMGRLVVHPTEICVIPRGVVFSVNIFRPPSAGGESNGHDEAQAARGYILEVFKGHFALPELGPIGSNGLANARDFLYPTAWYESDPRVARKTCDVVNKFGNELFRRPSPHSPYNVVAWHGTYAPYKYDLTKFCAVNSVTYDHPDPSIYTVLTAQSDEAGTALADFVIFPPRIMATDDNTFRPPWYHRNTMSEFMGLIYGTYDAKRKGFVPGGASLHNTMTPHGPDADTYRRAVEADCSHPTKFDGGLAFMFESSLTMRCSEYALTCGQREVTYAKCWDGLEDNFSGSKMMMAKDGGTEEVVNGGGEAGSRESKRPRLVA